MGSHVCVPIRAALTTAGDDADAARDAGANLIEFRVDGLYDGSPETITLIQRLVKQSALPCIVTCRAREEGGDFEGDDTSLADLCRALRDADDPPRYVDVEFVRFERSAELRESLRLPAGREAPGLILSMHDFDGRPADLARRVRAMREEPAARVLKIAYRARSIRDNLELFDILQTRDRPTIALGMGEFGLMSRVLAPKFGGLLTFASLRSESASAPGQPTIEELLGRYRFRSIGRDTRVYGVVGWPVSHSLSPLVHNAGFEAVGHDGVYLPMPVAAGETGGRAGASDGTFESFKATLDELSLHPTLGFAGASVTLPHKEHAIAWAKREGIRIEPGAERIGAANTIAIERGMHGEAQGAIVVNTDATAAAVCLARRIGDLEGKRVAVLGAGGVARAVAFACADAGAQVTLHNRTHERARALASELGAIAAGSIVAPDTTEPSADADAIVNCTPIGMASGPAPDASPVSEATLRETGAVVFDTVYNPAQTPLLRAARAAGRDTIDGVSMFVAQGEQQFRLWTGTDSPAGLFERLCRDTLG